MNISTLDGTPIEWVERYKYLGIWFDKHLNFKFHVDSLSKKLKSTLSFFYRLKRCFACSSRKQLVTGIFMSQLDYGDNIYRFACSSTLAKLDPIYHAALPFITNSPFGTHHCLLYENVGWPSLSSRRMKHWYLFCYKALLGTLPTYISSKFVLVRNGLNLRSNTWLRCVVPSSSSEGGKKCLAYFGPWSWNDLQTRLKLPELISFRSFKKKISELLINVCSCFDAR